MQKTNTCHWLQNSGKYHPIVWKTDCGRKWFFDTDGHVQANGINFCPFCGGVLVIVENIPIKNRGKVIQLDLV